MMNEIWGGPRDRIYPFKVRVQYELEPKEGEKYGEDLSAFVTQQKAADLDEYHVWIVDDLGDWDDIVLALSAALELAKKYRHDEQHG